MACFQYDVDWQAVGAIATLIAAFVALFVGLWPTLSAASERKERAKAYGTILCARLERSALHAEVARKIASLEPKSVNRFNNAVLWGISLDYEGIVEASTFLHLFNEELARKVAAAIADIETCRSLLMPRGEPITKSVGADLTQPNISDLLQKQAESLARARDALHALVYKTHPADLSEPAERVVVASDRG